MAENSNKDSENFPWNNFSEANGFKSVKYPTGPSSKGSQEYAEDPFTKDSKNLEETKQDQPKHISTASIRLSSETSSNGTKRDLTKSVSLSYGASPFRKSLASQNSSTDIPANLNRKASISNQGTGQHQGVKELDLSKMTNFTETKPKTNFYRRFSNTINTATNEPTIHKRFVQAEEGKEVKIVKNKTQKAIFRRKSIVDMAIEENKKEGNKIIMEMMGSIGVAGEEEEWGRE